MEDLFLQKLFDLYIVIVIENKIYASVHNIMDNILNFFLSRTGHSICVLRCENEKKVKS